MNTPEQGRGTTARDYLYAIGTMEFPTGNRAIGRDVGHRTIAQARRPAAVGQDTPCSMNTSTIIAPYSRVT